MRLYILSVMLIFSAILCNSTVAAELVEKTAVKTENSGLSKFGELDELRSKNAVLAERVRQLELLEKLRAGGMSSMGTQVANPQVTNTRTNQKPSTKGAAVSVNAQVQLVSGVGTINKASIMTSNGAVFNVQVGSNIPEVGTIKSITLNEVIVTTKAGPVSIPFALPTQDPQMGQATGMPSSSTQQMPPFPMGMIPRGAQ